MRIIAACFLIVSAAPLMAQTPVTDDLEQRLRAWSRPPAPVGVAFSQALLHPDEASRPHYQADSMEFAAFLQALQRAQKDEGPPYPTSTYRLVWHEVRVGLDQRIQRGDGRRLEAVLAAIADRGQDASMPGDPQYRGARFAVMGRSAPTGVINYAYWYFEREE